jgi:hypothetical protein
MCVLDRAASSTMTWVPFENRQHLLVPTRFAVRDGAGYE